MEHTKEMKSVLILGGFGFLGTNTMKFAEEQQLDEYHFIVFDKFDHHPADVQFANIDKVYAGDFTDSELLERIFKENRIDIVLHSLSTTIPVDSSNARFDVESNLLPTLDVLRLMVKYDVKDIVYLSSGGAIYGTASNASHKESDDVFPVSSYGVVKLAIEKYMMQYAQLYGLSPLILRLSNPYGPYHYGMKQGVVNVALAKALKNDTLEIWGSGEDKKDYIYVDDYVNILFGLLSIKEQLPDFQRGMILNIASGELLSVNEIVNNVKHLVPTLKVEYKEKQKFDASHFELNTEKLFTYMWPGEPGYSFTSFEDGLKKTFEWAKTIC